MFTSPAAFAWRWKLNSALGGKRFVSDRYRVLLKRLMLVIGCAMVGGYALLAVVLFLIQDRMIYFPRRYAPSVVQHLPSGLVGLRDADGSVVGFYRGPVDGLVPQRLWFIFGGNADQALNWDMFAIEPAQADTGFLLMEYPGYGVCAGKPSPVTILAANERAVVLLAQRLGLTVAAIDRRAGHLGHSLGAAVALQYAARHGSRRLVLISPFTTMKAMARRRVGWPLCELLVHRFDNRARLAEIAAKASPPTAIIHGDRDDFIPLAMGIGLAQEHPTIALSVIAGAGHDDVLLIGDGAISAAMDGMP